MWILTTTSSSVVQFRILTWEGQSLTTAQTFTGGKMWMRPDLTSSLPCRRFPVTWVTSKYETQRRCSRIRRKLSSASAFAWFSFRYPAHGLRLRFSVLHPSRRISFCWLWVVMSGTPHERKSAWKTSSIVQTTAAVVLTIRWSNEVSTDEKQSHTWCETVFVWVGCNVGPMSAVTIWAQVPWQPRPSKAGEAGTTFEMWNLSKLNNWNFFSFFRIPPCWWTGIGISKTIMKKKLPQLWQ